MRKILRYVLPPVLVVTALAGSTAPSQAYADQSIVLDGARLCYQRTEVPGQVSARGTGPTRSDFDGDGFVDLPDIHMQHLGWEIAPTTDWGRY